MATASIVDSELALSRRPVGEPKAAGPVASVGIQRFGVPVPSA